MKGLTCKQIARLLEVEINSEETVLGFEADSRKIAPGWMFFALRGETVDGHQFLQEVESKKAACAVVSQEFQGSFTSLPLIRVPNVLEAMQRLARMALIEKRRTLVGVTGSVGKTTTKEFISVILEGAFSVAKTPGNANSQIGLPLSILNASLQEEVFVAEMGMSRHGEIQNLVEIAPPDIAVITKVALSHAEYFPEGIEGIAQAKSEILSHPNTRDAIIHVQARQFEVIRSRGNACKTYYGLSGDPTQEALFDIARNCILQRERQSPPFFLPFTATHLCENFLAAALVAEKLGMDWQQIARQAEKLSVYPRRFELIEKQGVTYINDAYNASPESMKAALHNLPKPKSGGKTVVVLGEMRELGSFSEKAHREVGWEAAKVADLMLCVGKECRFMAEEFSKASLPVFHFMEFLDLQQACSLHIAPSDVVLIKASNSWKLWRILDV